MIEGGEGYGWRGGGVIEVLSPFHFVQLVIEKLYFIWFPKARSVASPVRLTVFSNERLPFASTEHYGSLPGFDHCQA